MRAGLRVVQSALPRPVCRISSAHSGELSRSIQASANPIHSARPSVDSHSAAWLREKLAHFRHSSTTEYGRSHCGGCLRMVVKRAQVLCVAAPRVFAVVAAAIWEKIGALGAIRTPDPQIRSLLQYLIKSAGYDNFGVTNAPTVSLIQCCHNDRSAAFTSDIAASTTGTPDARLRERDRSRRAQALMVRDTCAAWLMEPAPMTWEAAANSVKPSRLFYRDQLQSRQLDNKRVAHAAGHHQDARTASPRRP